MARIEAGAREHGPADPREFLGMLLAREAIPNDSAVAVVVAHPDDESIAYGAQIARFPGCLMVHMTDGAPENPKYRQGMSREAYAATRKGELAAALHEAGHTGPRRVMDVADQELTHKLAESARALADLFIENGTAFVLTHAYEGGHPDHDSVAFAVHAAQKLLAEEGHELHIIEAPLYQAGKDGEGFVWQDFVPVPDTETVTLELTHAERALKERLYAAHASQSGTFAAVGTASEKMRIAPQYDFTALANGGNVSRIFKSAGITAEKWRERATLALRSLGLG